MSKFKFKTSDFLAARYGESGRNGCMSAETQARRANEILDNHLATLPKVRNGDNTRKWTTDIEPYHRHQAVLFNLEPIEQPDSAESLLRELVESTANRQHEVWKRATKFLYGDKK